MKPRYAFNLGRVFTLSLAELFAVFENMNLSFRIVSLYREVLVIETETELNIKDLQDRLGGVIKIMRVIDSLGRKKLLGPSKVFQDYFDTKVLKEKILANTKGKIQVGISVYPMAKQLPLRGEVKNLGLMIKSVLTTAGMSCRIVFPQKEAIALPSVVVTNEHLLEKGAEIDFLVTEDRVFLAKTISVQDFEAYGRRDYQRPVRDMQIGMLPPKVAQVMINLAQLPPKMKGNPDQAILDPFVGTGTVLQEAMIQGYKGIGADISEHAIEGTEKNLLWVKNRYKVPPNRFELIVSDVKDLEIKMPEAEVKAVITEGTLGPSYGHTPSAEEAKKNFENLEKVYINAFTVFKKILKSGARVVIALPAYRTGIKSYIYCPFIDKLKKLGYDIVDPVPTVVTETFPFLEVTDRKSMLYDRKDQVVSREIFIFKVK